MKMLFSTVTLMLSYSDIDNPYRQRPDLIADIAFSYTDIAFSCSDIVFSYSDIGNTYNERRDLNSDITSSPSQP